MVTRRWKPILGLLVGTALLGRAWSIHREIGWLPLSVPSASLLVRPLDTSVVLPGSGRYQLVHDFAIPPGSARGPLLAAGPLVEFDGAVAGRRWSTSESGSTGSYGSSDTSAGFFLGSVAAMRGDTLRLTIRASPALREWVMYAPQLEVRRDYRDAMYAPLNRDLAGLAGLVAFALSAFAFWRSRRRFAQLEESN